MAPGLDFTIEIGAMRDLAVGADRVEALITVKASPGLLADPSVADMAVASAAAADAAGARLAEVLIMDRSMSMQADNKIPEASRAACAAIDALPDGALLGIIVGNHRARPLYPAAGGLAVVSADAWTDARQRVMALLPDGGTRIGRWLTAAAGAFAAVSAAGGVRHAVLCTDGKNEHETLAKLDAALARARTGSPARCGFGQDWDYREVRRVADALGGEAAAGGTGRPRTRRLRRSARGARRSPTTATSGAASAASPS